MHPMEITNPYELEEHLLDRFSEFLQIADVDEDDFHAFFQFCLNDAEE